MSSTDALDPPDLKVALKREREEHQHLLAESYAAVMDLTKQVMPEKIVEWWLILNKKDYKKNIGCNLSYMTMISLLTDFIIGSDSVPDCFGSTTPSFTCITSLQGDWEMQPYKMQTFLFR